MLAKAETISKLRSKVLVLAALHADDDQDRSRGIRRVRNDSALYTSTYSTGKSVSTGQGSGSAWNPECYKCGLRGHISTYCPNRDNKRFAQLSQPRVNSPAVVPFPILFGLSNSGQSNPRPYDTAFSKPNRSFSRMQYNRAANFRMAYGDRYRLPDQGSRSLRQGN